MAKSINWIIKTNEEGAVTVLSDGEFVIDALDGNNDDSLRALIDGRMTSGTYLMFYPVTGRAQLFIDHGYVCETDMPCEVQDFLRV